MSKLILVRHGRTDWNNKGLWTGKADPDISKGGIEDSKKAGDAILKNNIKLDKAFTSVQKRSIQTLDVIKETVGLLNIDTERSPLINERDYGVYTGKNKWQVKEEIGEEKFIELRRGWNIPIPEGESLKMVYERAVPYFESVILKEIISGKNVIIVSSGNALRSIIKRIENIKDEDIHKVEFGTGEVYSYDFDDKGNVLNKECLAVNTEKLKI
jgi:2,3-bisphosphoglycerate-dependent phosphoglycerate mutase